MRSDGREGGRGMDEQGTAPAIPVQTTAGRAERALEEQRDRLPAAWVSDELYAAALRRARATDQAATLRGRWASTGGQLAQLLAGGEFDVERAVALQVRLDALASLERRVLEPPGIPPHLADHARALAARDLREQGLASGAKPPRYVEELATWRKFGMKGDPPLVSDADLAAKAAWESFRAKPLAWDGRVKAWRKDRRPDVLQDLTQAAGLLAEGEAIHAEAAVVRAIVAEADRERVARGLTWGARDVEIRRQPDRTMTGTPV
jgi:hypothetical protein